MKQDQFEAASAPAWQAFENWLSKQKRSQAAHQSKRKKAAAAQSEAPLLQDEDMPAAYRALCQDLALARDRQYSSALVERLHHLVLEGHHALYGSQGDTGEGVLAFLRWGLPELVRKEWRFVVSALLLLFGPALILHVVLQYFPSFVHYFIPLDELRNMEAMYDPKGDLVIKGRDSAGADFAMWGHYIWNNVRIDFECFATGIFFGLGSIFTLIYNGMVLGAVGGHLTQIGYGQPFWSFVIGHGSFELLGAALSGAAGLQLGYALVSPGRYTRIAALQMRAKTAVRLLYGAATMTALAAFIEGFWSPQAWILPTVKYAVGGAGWLLLIVYFLFARRPHAD